MRLRLSARGVCRDGSSTCYLAASPVSQFLEGWRGLGPSRRMPCRAGFRVEHPLFGTILPEEF